MSDYIYDVFISHNSQDKPIVKDLANRLEADGLKVWLDEWEILAGDSILSKVEHGLSKSRHVVYMMSDNSINSNWVTLERLTPMFNDPLNNSRRLLPVLLEDTIIPDMIKQFYYIDWRKGEEHEYKKLLAACKDEKPPRKPSISSDLKLETTIKIPTEEFKRLTTQDNLANLFINTDSQKKKFDRWVWDERVFVMDFVTSTNNILAIDVIVNTLPYEILLFERDSDRGGGINSEFLELIKVKHPKLNDKPLNSEHRIVYFKSTHLKEIMLELSILCGILKSLN